jgi:hypothetical protein
VLTGLWKLIGLISDLVDWIKALLGFVQTVEHQGEQKKIDDAAKAIEKPGATDQEREDATHDLEDIANRHT